MSNSPFSGGVSSLLKGATSTAATIADFQDKAQAFDWGNSAYTDDAYSGYSQYLQNRIKTLQSTGSLADASKALTLMGTLRSAQKSNTSASITRENIAIMSGNASKTDKYNLISDQYVRAVDNGDLTLAQSLESQAYSLYQSIQIDQQNAASASQALAKATGTADAAQQQAVASELIKSIGRLNQDEQNTKTGGQQALDGAIKSWVSANKDTILKLNPEAAPALSAAIAKGAQPNYLDLVSGAIVAAANAHLLAATAVAPYSPKDKQDYIDSASALLNGQKFSTLAGDFTYQEIVQLAQTPNALTYNASTQRYDLNPVTGHVVDPTNGVVPTRGTDAPNLTPQQVATLTNLNLEVSTNKGGGANDGIQVKTTDQTPAWVQSITGKGAAINIYNVNGQLQFAGQSKAGVGQDVYTLATDGNGKHALIGTSDKTDPLGNHPAEISSSQPGFDLLAGHYNQSGGNQLAGSMPHTSFLSRLGNDISNTASPLFGLFGGHASAQSVISSAQSQFQLAQANATAARAMLSQAPPPLPNISLPPASAPVTPPLKVANVPSLQSITPGNNPAVAPKTVNPQPGATAPQQPGNINLQGGGFRLQ